MWHLPKGENRTSKASWTATTFEDSRMEMGRNWSGLHSQITSYPSRIWLDLGYSGSVNKSCSFHSSQDNLLRSQTRRLVYVPNSMPTWGTKKDCVRQGLAIHNQILGETSWINGYKAKFQLGIPSETDGQTKRTIQIREDMLRSYAFKYGKSWDKSPPYTEFSYKNSYQASIEIAPYEALYGWHCRTLLFCSQTGES
jgi:hypothetical protein